MRAILQLFSALRPIIDHSTHLIEHCGEQTQAQLASTARKTQKGLNMSIGVTNIHVFYEIWRHFLSLCKLKSGSKIL